MTPDPALPAATVGSPCNRICRIDAASGWCEGCRRNLDEIVAWPTLSDAQKRAVLAQLPGRRTLSPTPPATGGVVPAGHADAA